MATKVKKPTEIHVVWLHYDPIAAWKAGRQATLSISDGKKTDLYLVRPHFEGGSISYWALEKCREVAISLEKGEHDEYHVRADFTKCDCAWGVYKPNDKACKHRVGVAKALLDLESIRRPEPSCEKAGAA